MHVGIRTVAVAAVCGLCVGAGVDARAVRPNLSIAGTPTTRSVSSQAVSLASFSDLLAAAAPQNDAAAQMNSVGGGAVSSTDLIGTVAKLLATPNITQSGVTPGINTAAVGTVDPPSSEPVDPPTGQPTDPPAADEPAPPTNFPGERPAFGTPSYFAQLAFAVLHVLALPITVPVQAIIGKTEGVPSVIVAALNDLSSLLGQVPKPSAPVTDTKTTPQDSTSQQADKAAPTVDSASEKPGGATSGADAKASKIERNEHEGKTADKAAEVPKAEHETKPGAASEETPKTDPAKEVVEPKVDPAKVVESKTDPTKAVEPKADPTKVVEPQVVEPKVDPAKAVEPKTDPAKAVEPKADAAAEPAKPESSKPESSKAEVAKPVTAKPETKAQPAKPESAGPVKVTRDSLKSTPGETGTTGGTKTTEGSKGSVTDSKTPAASTDTKVHDGLKPAVGAKPDKPADKPSTEKSSSEKSGSSSEGSSHSSESKSHSSEGKSHSGSKD